MRFPVQYSTTDPVYVRVLLLEPLGTEHKQSIGRQDDKERKLLLVRFSDLNEKWHHQVGHLVPDMAIQGLDLED